VLLDKAARLLPDLQVASLEEVEVTQQAQSATCQIWTSLSRTMVFVDNAKRILVASTLEGRQVRLPIKAKVATNQPGLLLLSSSHFCSASKPVELSVGRPSPL